jgi:hypothetical protein
VHGLYSGYAKRLFGKIGYPEKGELPQYAIDHDGPVKGDVRRIASDR